MPATLPSKYKYLASEPGPKMLVEALKLLGTKEIKGSVNNATIMSWAKEIGGNVEKVYKADEVPWCGLVHAVIALRAGKGVVKDPLWALNWGTFGDYVEEPMLGDTLVFVRTTATGKRAGHVGLYVGEDDTAYHVLGGNQSDSMSITRIAKDRLYTSRRPKYKVMPPNVRRIFLNGDNNSLSNNEE